MKAGTINQVSIAPDHAIAPTQPNGRVDLYNQASRYFARLGTANTFTADRNTFDGVVHARRFQVTSDARAKADIQPLDGRSSAQLVGSIRPQSYLLDGQPAAGLLAQDVPASYTHASPEDGTLSVDYNSLFTHLWAAVQHLQGRVDTLEAELLVRDGGGEKKRRTQ